jgi:hypothetical protein
VILVARSANCVNGVGTCIHLKVGSLPLELVGIVILNVSLVKGCRLVVVDFLTWGFQHTTYVREVWTGYEQIGNVSLGVSTGDLDFLTKVVALVTRCDDGYIALLYLDIDFIRLVLASGFAFYTDSVLLVLGVFGGLPLNGSGSTGIEFYKCVELGSVEFGIVGDILLDALPCTTFILVLTDFVWSCRCVLLDISL